jgi:iron complex outermembrane recepter protein
MYPPPKFHRASRLALLLAAATAGLGQAAEPTLPTVEVSTNAPRADLQADSLKNPYRVEATGTFGTEVFTRDDIEALAPKDVFDLLDKAVGLNVSYQGRRSPYSVQERGGGNLTYILDGAVLPTSSNRILQKIPMAAIEQIQIVRGSTSLALGPSIPIGASNSGSGLNTGFVIIRTRQPKGTEAEISAFVEQADGQPTANGQSLYAGTQLGEADALNGYLAGMTSRRDVPSKDSWFDGQNADAQMVTGGVKFGRFSLNTMAYQDSGRFEMQRGVTLTGALDSSKWYYDPLKTTVVSSDAGMAWNEDQITLLSVFNTKFEQSEHNESFANNTALMRQFNEETRGYSLRHNARFGNTLLQLGKQYTESEGLGPNCNTPYNNWRTSVDGTSAALEQKLFGGDVIVDGGYRRDIKHIDHAASSTSATLTAAQTAKLLAANAGKDLAPARIYTLGGRWQINPTYALNGRYFDGDEGTSGDFSLRTVSSAPLHAESQKRKEVALEANLVSYFKPMLTWFDVAIQNQKTASTTTYIVDGATYYYYTEADSRRRGLELLVKGDIGANTAYSFSATHLFTNTTTNAGITTDALGLSSPRNSYTARLSHAWGDYRANLSVKKVGPWNASTSPMGTSYNVNLGDYTRIDANVMRDFVLGGHKVTTELYGRNLGNDHYATLYTTGYYYDRGRTIGLQLTARY